MTSAAVDRRIAPRFAVKTTGELASGSAVTDVRISDISVTGCGIEIVEPTGEVLGGFGVLSLSAPDRRSAPVMLPVVICNHHLKNGKIRLGLQFRRLNMNQMRSLIGFMDGLIDK